MTSSLSPVRTGCCRCSLPVGIGSFRPSNWPHRCRPCTARPTLSWFWLLQRHCPSGQCLLKMNLICIGVVSCVVIEFVCRLIQNIFYRNCGTNVCAWLKLHRHLLRPIFIDVDVIFCFLLILFDSFSQGEPCHLFIIKSIWCFWIFPMCRDVQKQKALVKNESLQTILSGEKLQYVIITQEYQHLGQL